MNGPHDKLDFVPDPSALTGTEELMARRYTDNSSPWQISQECMYIKFVMHIFAPLSWVIFFPQMKFSIRRGCLPQAKKPGEISQIKMLNPNLQELTTLTCYLAIFWGSSRIIKTPATSERILNCILVYIMLFSAEKLIYLFPSFMGFKPLFFARKFKCSARIKFTLGPLVSRKHIFNL